METTELDLNAPGGELQAAMAYLAVLAYPESHLKRNRSMTALFALLNRAARGLGKPLSPIASELFRDVPPKKQAQTLGTGRKGMLPRIYRRLKAADAASRCLWPANDGSPSLNDIADAYRGDRSYFLHTVWAESKPVLHLALALKGILYRWHDDGRPAIQLLARPSWVREALRSAENWRRMLSLGERAVTKRAPDGTWYYDGPEFYMRIDADSFIRLIAADHSDSTTG